MSIKIIKIGTAGILLAVAFVAEAAPVYLECTMTDGQKDLTWNVVTDEANGTISYSIPELGTASKYPAVFSPDKVVFSSMEISRIDLSFKRTSNILGDVKTDVGQCKLATAPKRQF
ncbi:hypothetical protein [Stenotrophobium rhamnosiphilum]|uniref:Uncharacterized protein n=1 Tax=Stenotrophobium rhamnosiphilum TaxID=2029166 RepID=A0A2T5MI67_9GAMM|nr:hypothetical protein [Stenotrophobium rhamnosiphilum]PTU32250.1 hypothetical protein CJD38_06225 [Stenotrophobium rhamnosiphilum]